MVISEISSILSSFSHSEINFDKIFNELKKLKLEAVSKKQEKEAKEIWILEQIGYIQKSYLEVFDLFKSKEYYKAWCLLERIEICLMGLKRHFKIKEQEYFLSNINKCVYNLQSIYPYKIFFSSEILHLEKKCNICDQIVSVRNPCGHKVHEIYNGEYCLRIVTKSKLLGIAVVDNPVNKFSVAFPKDGTTDQSIDNYNYETIDYLLDLLDSPFDIWDVDFQKRLIPHSQFKNYGTYDLCPCSSGKKYKFCCLKKKGVEIDHIEFILKNPSKKTLLTRTIKPK